MPELSIPTALMPVAIAAVGWVLHILKKLIEAKRDGKPVSVVSYLNDYRYETVFSVFATIAAMYLGMSVDDVVALADVAPTTAFASGFMGNSIVDGFSAARRNLE